MAGEKDRLAAGAPKKIRLSYPIKNKEAAFLAGGVFESEPEKIRELKKAIEKEEGILRFLLNKKEIAREKPAKRADKERPKMKALPKKLKTKPEKKVDLKVIEKDLDKILDES